MRNVSALLVPLAFVVSYAAGRALFRSTWGGVAGLVAQFALIGLAPEHTGTLRSLSQPGVAARQLLVPALLALVFTYMRERKLALLGAMGAGAVALALIHPTYAVFLCVPLAGFLIARVLMAGRDVKALSASLVTLIVPSAAVAFFLLPIVKKTASYATSTYDLHRGLAKYAGQIDFYSDHSYRLSPQLFSRSGAVAVAGLVCIPLAALAARRRWSAYVLGGSLAIFALTLVPFVFPRFADAVSLSQARREGGFLPFAFALVGAAAVLTGLISWAVLPVAVGAGIALQLAFPGDFGYNLTSGGPALATWIGALGGAVALGDRHDLPPALVDRAPGAVSPGRRRPVLCAARRERIRKSRTRQDARRALSDGRRRHGAARKRARRRHRLLGRRDRVPDRGICARVRQRRAAVARGRHRRTTSRTSVGSRR